MATVTRLGKVPSPGKAARPPGPPPAAGSHGGHAQQIGYASSVLAFEAINFREKNGAWGMCNVAVVQYTGKDGKTHMLAMSSGDAGHSERQILDTLTDQGIIPPPDKVTALYTEREPCVLSGANCRSELERRLPGVPVTYTFEYGDSPESRQRGNAALAQELTHFRPGDTRSEVSGRDVGLTTVTASDRLESKQDLHQLSDHFKHDPQVTAIIEGRAAGHSFTEIRDQMSRKEYEGARARLAEYRGANP